MKFVQEDADNNMFESCHEKVLADLEEIKDRLQCRLQDSEMALREKDKELTERFENELKLRQALDAKEKELVALQNANVELERTKSDGVAELSMSSPGSRDEDRDSEISELMHSVDQQVLHIEHEVIDEERNGGIDHKKIEQMGSDINILKETLHQAFEKMQNAIFLSELGPQEQQWRWTIEKDAICTLINGEFVHCKDWNEKIGNYRIDRLVTEEVSRAVFDETIRDVVNTANYTFTKLQEVEEIQEFVFREAMKDACQEEGRKQDKSSSKNRDGSFEGNGEESFIKKLDMLLKCLEEDGDLMVSASSEVNEQKKQFDWVEMETEKLNEHEIFQELMNEDESTFTSVRSELEKALDRLATSKTKMSELESSLGTADYDQERVDDQMIPADNFSHVFGNFELQAQEKLADKVLRLEEMKHRLDLLVELVSSIQKRELLYRTAFIRRRKNLQMAETEVDLLGDQVDALIGLLDKIYTTLHQHSPVLQQHFEMSNDKFPPISSRDTVASLDSYESFNDRKYNLPPASDEKEDAVNLSDKNFSDILAKNQHVMVAFYAPWCFWSKKLAPEYEAAATELKGKAVLAKVNDINEIELAKRWGIQGYPTIYFFVNGVHVDTYYHNRKKDAIVNYIKTKMAGDLYTGLEGEVLAAASKPHPDVLFFQTTRADVAKMFLIDPEIKRPALVLLEKESKQLSHFDGSFTISVIDDFISSNKIPPMITYSRETTPLILNSPLKLLWLFAAVHDSEAKSIFQETVRAFKGKVIAVASIRKRKKYVLNGELTLSNVKSFALDFLGDKFRNQQSKTALSQIQLQQKSLTRLPVPDMMTKEAI
ncbi:hypothetical protein CUMW_258470 [Citrus unshiu]|uniref:Thioredoxin domain-containing protein n=1 Tax=Citrus unshiu TaxID=55188 RepID=A0A2H5QSW8_CITUN|nr:hypothetical protein CUMW_258470 [Citrus unshiu]